MHISSKPTVTLAAGTLVVLAALSAPAVPSTGDPSQDVDKLMIVDCMLPGKIMRLGGGARYMSARRPVKTTGVDCEIRGGEYIAYDRASYATSLKVWLPDAKSGDPKAQTYVGEMFEQGLGTMPDYETAVAWYRKAADQGYDRAQMNLGSMYERGLGVEKNELEALNWYRKATGMADDELVLSSEVEALEAEAEGLRVALASSEAEVASLKNSLTVSRQEMNNSQARLSNSLLELEEMRFRAAQVKSVDGQSADVTALNEEIQKKEAELAGNRQELMDLRIAFDRQEAQFAAQLSTQQGDQSSYQALLDLEREKIKSLESQVSQLTGNLDYRQSELSTSNKQLTALRRQLEAQSINDKAATDASIAELSAIIAAQQAELDNKSNNITALETDLKRQKSALASEQRAFEEREKGILQSADSDNSEQQAALTQERSRIASLQGQVANLSRELDLKQSSLDQSNTQLEVLNRQLRVAGSEQASSEDSLAELSGVIATQQTDLEQKMLSISFLEQELVNQQQQLSAERTAYEQRESRLLENADIMQVEKQSMETRLEQIQNQLASYQQQLIESDRLIQNKEADILARQDEISKLKNDQQQRESTGIRNLQAQLGKKEIELASVKGSNSALATEKVAMESELVRLRQQLAEGVPTVAMRGTYTVPSSPPRKKPVIPDINFGEYHALIIGNNNYSELPQLQTPVNDARAMATILEKKYQFKTQLLINADRKSILLALSSYLERLTEDDNFLLYYAGHGELDEQNNRGHWLPIDANPPPLDVNWISNVQITDYINAMKAKHVMVIADSCYAGTLTRGVTTYLPPGKSRKMAIEHYTRLTNKISRSVLTSGGTVPVMDGGGGAHSIFANSLLRALESNNAVLQAEDLHRDVSQRVSSSGMNDIGQNPGFDRIHNTGDTGGRFFFVPG